MALQQKEALEKLCWSRADIKSLLDEELYLGVPELLIGELEFRSHAENREEFLHNIATGRYSERSSWNVCTLSTYLIMCVLDIGCTTEKGCQVLQAKSTPGSWHENGVLNLVLGVDFFIWRVLPNLEECYIPFDDYNRRQMWG